MYLSNCIYLKFIFDIDNKHVLDRKIIACFLYDICKDNIYYYNFSHPDLPATSTFEQFKCSEIINNANLLVPNKIEYMYLLDNTMYDLNLIELSTHGVLFFENEQVHEKTNYIIPYVIHQRTFLNECKSVKLFIKHNDCNVANNYFFYDDLSIAMYNIERNGLCIDCDSFTKNFNVIRTSSIIYSKYNIRHYIGRPSNSNYGINFVAIPKTKVRNSFISRFNNGKLLLFDFKAFHPMILSKLIKYKIYNNEYFYNKIANEYFKTDRLDKQHIIEIKKKVLIELYNDSYGELSDIDFFKKVNDFKIKCFNFYQKYGYIQTPIYKRKLYKNILGNINKSKLLAYLLQAIETEVCISKLKLCLEYINNKKILPILYTYDSFLFDTDSNILSSDIINIKEILEKGGFQIQCYIGNNYGNINPYVISEA